jgi:NhaP-type Na+/H+ and K+/H+ antiporter
MFIMLGLLVDVRALLEPQTLLLGVGVAMFMMFVARPMAVFV